MFINYEHAKKVNMITKPKWTCRLCGRSKFTYAGQPHKCAGGWRVRFRKAAVARGWDNVWILTPVKGKIMKWKFKEGDEVFVSAMRTNAPEGLYAHALYVDARLPIVIGKVIAIVLDSVNPAYYVQIANSTTAAVYEEQELESANSNSIILPNVEDITTLVANDLNSDGAMLDQQLNQLKTVVEKTYEAITPAFIGLIDRFAILIKATNVDGNSVKYPDRTSVS